MPLERPDLTQLDPSVRDYIESLEAELAQLQAGRSARDREEVASPFEPDEPPTTVHLVTLSASGVTKRTARYLYSRQRRGGMGIFDLETSPSGDDPPAFLALADESETLVILTNQARAFRLPVADLPSVPVRSRGQALASRLTLHPDERRALVFTDLEGAYVALLTHTGQVRWYSGGVFGKGLNAGTQLWRVEEFGLPVSACWATGSSDLFLATAQGKAIRFPFREVPLHGGPGIRLTEGDRAVALAAVRPESGVLLLGADGMGTMRQMSGFAANKSPGSGGRIALTTDRLVSARTLEESDDLFVISRLGKIIRFPAVSRRRSRRPRRISAARLCSAGGACSRCFRTLSERGENVFIPTT